MIDLDAIKARCEAASPRPWIASNIAGIAIGVMHEVTDADARFTQCARADIPALVAEVEHLRGSLAAVLDEATSDLDRDIIITECQSALASHEEGTGDAGT